MSKVLAVIPARGGSKRVPRKNLRELDGKPLVAHIMHAAMRAKHIDRVILSSDDDEILEIGKECGIDIPFVRPSDLGGDTSPLVAVNVHAYEYFKKQGEYFDAVMSIQPSCPFLSSHTLDQMVVLWKKVRSDSVTTVAEITQGHPYISKNVGEESRLSDFVNIPEGAVLGPSNKRKKAYYLTGGCYLRAKHLLEQKELKFHVLGDDARGVIVNDIEAVDINTEMDFKYAEFLVKQGLV